MGRGERGFSLVEVLVSIAVIAVLLSFLVPALRGARSRSVEAVCSANLRQVGIAWLNYLGDNKERFPKHTDAPEWNYGGVVFASGGPGQSEPRRVLGPDRPINRYLASEDAGGELRGERGAVFHCLGDVGVQRRHETLVHGSRRRSVLEGGTCFATYGTSYRANEYLMDSTRARIDSMSRPLSLYELGVSPSRLLLMGDAGWAYAVGAVRGTRDGEFEASWHRGLDVGNMLGVDGSARRMDFRTELGRGFEVDPRPIDDATRSKPTGGGDPASR